MKIFALITVLATSLALVAQEADKIVVYDNCGDNGQQAHVTQKSGNYTYSSGDISTELIAKDSNLRSVIYGERVVELTYGGLKADGNYKVRLRFLSDHTDRVQRIKVNGKVVVDKLALPINKEVIKVISISREACELGKIKLTIEAVEGVNCVLSDATLLSNFQELDSCLELSCSLTVGPSIEGKVIDLNSGKPIEGAKITVGDLRTDSALDGSFSIPIKTSNKDVLLNVKKGRLVLTKLFKAKDFHVFSKPRLSQRPGKKELISLNGTWNFLETLPKDFPNNLGKLNKKITVPGEWVMQGFEVKKNTPAAFCRSFVIPNSMKNKRIKLRFDAVYSDCKVFVNGIKVGSHLGGFTPFELDITDAVRIGDSNTVALSVQSESVADTMASGSKYACHQLGGINRKVTLFSLPQANISSLAIRTDLDENFHNAQLNIELGVTNDGESRTKQSVKLYLTDPHGRNVPLASSVINFVEILPKEQVTKDISFQILNPEKWTNETPVLYQLRMELSTGEIYSKNIGFKEVHVQGTTLFVNGMPVKLRGCNRHEVHPLTGRSLFGDLWEQDVKLFRAANMNLIRTCHYPPAEELMDAADKLGIFIEVEGPYCWEMKPKDPSHLKLTVQQNMEMVIRDRNHPSVLMWSIANESSWGPNFIAASKAMRKLDPTRPQTWNHWSANLQTDSEGYCELANIHYPGYRGPAIAKKYNKRPLYSGEYIHLNAYNRLELASDRGLRDQWGKYFLSIWEKMYHEPAVVGGSIWSGIDDTFFLKNDRTVGYGTWGPIDGWRRPKPEWFHIKKVYSPIRILNQKEISVEKGIVSLQIENRQDFSNLDRLKITWRYGSKSGQIKSNIPPKTSGVVKLEVGQVQSSTLFLTFTDQRGFEVDHFALPLTPRVGRISNMRFYNCSIHSLSDQIEIIHGDLKYYISRKTGLFSSVKGKKPMKINGPHLMILPLNRTGSIQMLGKTLNPKPFTTICKNWEKESITIKDQTITVKGSYKEAEGYFVYNFKGNGDLKIDYKFTSKIKVNPRQIGLVFDMPKEFNNLTWDRKGLWTAYPKDHIGRLKGTVNSKEGVKATSVGPKTQPTHPWRLDRGPSGSHDFASTKHNIYTVSLTDKDSSGLIAYANADRHARSWIYDDHLRLLIAYFSNGGSERFLRRLSTIDDRPLKAGSKIESSVLLRFN